MIQIREYSKGEPVPSEMLQLYVEAFPPDERRLWLSETDVTEFMSSHPEMHISFIYSNNTFAGFIIYWELEQALYYVEHLATLPEIRGKGLGRTLINTLLKRPGTSTLLEVEPPVDELTARRINFYKRLGLVLHSDFHYLQPPYAEGLKPVKLCLMTTPGITDEILSSRIVPNLHTLVYNK